MNIGAFLMAHAQPPKLVQASHRAFNQPACFSEAAPMFGIALGKHGLDSFLV